MNYEQANAPDTPFQLILMVPQSKTEQVLLSVLRDVQLEVERNVKVDGIEQDKEGVYLEAQHTGGESLHLQAQYVVGRV